MNQSILSFWRDFSNAAIDHQFSDFLLRTTFVYMYIFRTTNQEYCTSWNRMLIYCLCVCEPTGHSATQLRWFTVYILRLLLLPIAWRHRAIKHLISNDPVNGYISLTFRLRFYSSVSHTDHNYYTNNKNNNWTLLQEQTNHGLLCNQYYQQTSDKNTIIMNCSNSVEFRWR